MAAERQQKQLNVVEQYLATFDDSKLGRYFSIQRIGVNQYMIGDKNVLVDKKSNISVGYGKYEYTPGLWELIMMKSPPVASYTKGDLLNCRRLVQQTNVMTYP